MLKTIPRLGLSGLGCLHEMQERHAVQVQKLRDTKAGSKFTLLLRDHREHTCPVFNSVDSHDAWLSDSSTLEATQFSSVQRMDVCIQIFTTFPSNQLSVPPCRGNFRGEALRSDVV